VLCMSVNPQTHKLDGEGTVKSGRFLGPCWLLWQQGLLGSSRVGGGQWGFFRFRVLCLEWLCQCLQGPGLPWPHKQAGLCVAPSAVSVLRLSACTGVVWAVRCTKPVVDMLPAWV
jgi:hypothetical protein